jgi:hypothetical protein
MYAQPAVQTCSLDVCSVNMYSLDVRNANMYSLDVCSVNMCSLDVCSLDVCSLDVCSVNLCNTNMYSLDGCPNQSSSGSRSRRHTNAWAPAAAAWLVGNQFDRQSHAHFEHRNSDGVHVVLHWRLQVTLKGIEQPFASDTQGH